MERNSHGIPGAPGKPEEPELEELYGIGHTEADGGYRPGPTWRGLVIAVVAAVMLSVGATLLLGGSYGFTRGASGCGAGAVSDCCAPSKSGPGGG
ncbi:MAG: hypothetical protein Kow00128_06730 [Deltaproteobacteria bacterium]